MNNPVSGDAEKFQLGHHICSIFNTNEQQFLPLISFFNEGLTSKQKCLYILGAQTAYDVINEFDSRGVRVRDYADSKQLVFLTKDETYLRDGYFEADKMISIIKKIENQSLSEGYTGVRGSGDMTWAIGDPLVKEKMFNYEIKLNQLLSEGKIAAFCRYDERKFPKELLIKAIRTHPYLIIYGKFYENKYFYSPPEYVSNEDLPDESYETIISLITEN